MDLAPHTEPLYPLLVCALVSVGRADGLSPIHGAIVSTLSVCACECRQSRWT